MDSIDIERLKRDLMDYFGTATSFYPAFYEDVTIVKYANEEKLKEMAINNGFDLEDYKLYTLNL